MALLRGRFGRLLFIAALGLMVFVGFAARAATDEQVKAVFVFNFTHFVEWPVKSGSPTEPVVLGVLGNDSFADRLSEVVQGEKLDEHPLIVRRFTSIAEIGDCAVLFIDKSLSRELPPLIAALDHRSTLTVTDAQGGAEQGVMMQFVTENNRIRLRINTEMARSAGLTISSKLLRPAEIVSGSGN